MTTAASGTYSRLNPFHARITQNFCLTKPGSSKETRHLVVDIQGSGLKYEPGSSLGVFPQNPPAIVDELLKLLKIDPATLVDNPQLGTDDLRDLLLKTYTLNRVNKKFVRAVYDKLTPSPEHDRLGAIVAHDESFNDYIYSRDFVDVLKEFPKVKLTASELLDCLNKIAPRLYSIASAQDCHPDEVHLTVAVVFYTTHGREKLGLASGWLGRHTVINEPNVPIFIQPSKHFHLPADGNTPIIMVGPGTGIAPFRAFLEKRAFDGAKGANWLFFGEQHRAYDFLYEDEFNEMQNKGLLQRLDVAFSRDQTQKIYVQDRMREHSSEIWKWLQNGAYFYVCGDAKRMAKDVHQTLLDIAQNEGKLSLEAATEYIEVTLAKTEKRYLRDVY